MTSNGVNEKIALRDLNLPFEGKNIKNNISLHMPSNGVIAKVVLRDLDLLFEGHLFKMLACL